MSSLLSHPINPVLLLCLLYALKRILFPITSVPRTLPAECKAGYSWMPRRHTPTLRFTTYTPRTLAKFDGHDGGRILFAIAGIVFDVTGGKGFYGPGEPHVTFFLTSRARGGGKVTDGFI
jgi:membrane-associated progesterone receptor component